MAGQIKINHPPDQKTIKVKADANSKGFFAAFGTAKGGTRRVKVLLTDNAGNEVPAGLLHFLRGTDKGGNELVHWVAAFPGVQFVKHTLTVSDHDDTTTATQTSSFTVAVAASPAFKRKPPKKGLKTKASKASRATSALAFQPLLVHIENPAQGTTDPIPADSFCAYGTTDQLLPMYAVLGVPGASPVTGSLLQGPPNTLSWVFQFTQVPTGTGATLTVYAYNDGSDSVQGLTVS
jgi:hypothetical protein